MRFLLGAVGIAALLYAALCGALFFAQRSFLYLPPPVATRNPASSVTLPVDGADLVITVRAHRGPKALVYFGGNGEDVVASLDAFSRTFPDHALYLVDYRGYGGSSGQPSEEAIASDALRLFDVVRREHPDIALIGRSLGSGVAIRLAAERPATHLVLVTPYDSIAELAARRFPYVPVRWLLTDRYESFRYAPIIRVPTLLVGAADDEVIPRDSTERLLGRFAPGVATMTVIEHSGHNTWSNRPQHLATFRAAL